MIRTFKIMTVDRNDVQPDDQIMENGHWTTLCHKDFRRCPLLGRTIRGNCYGPSYTVKIRRLTCSE